MNLPVALLFLIVQGDVNLDPPTDRAKRALEELREKHGKDFHYRAFGFIAHACRSSERVFRRTNRFLQTFSRYARKHLFDRPPVVLRVVSFEDRNDFYRFAGRRGISGYYNHSRRMLVNNLNDGLGTVAHEMSHALMYADWKGRPNGWFLEGLGALMENCLRDRNGAFIGISYSHWRFPALRRRIQRARSQPLRDHMKQRKPDVNSYAQGRWILTYLFHEGLLTKYVREFRESVRDDPSGIFALEKVTGMKLSEFERAWLDWSRGIEVETSTLHSPHLFPVLGIIGRESREGLEIAGVSPHSTADRAKLQEGDVILRADGRVIRSMKDLLDVLRTKSGGSEVELEYLGGQEEYKVTVHLNQFIDG